VFLLCIGGVAALGLVTEQIAIGPLQGSGVHAELVTTIGIATILDGVAGVIWGQNPLQVPFFASNAPLTVLSGRITPDEIVIVVAVCVLVIALNTWSKVTLFGLASLAVSENRRAATLRGISARRYSAVAVVLTGAFSGALGPSSAQRPTQQRLSLDRLVIGGFVALVIGGFESKLGALVAAWRWRRRGHHGRYAGEEYQNLIIFGSSRPAALSAPRVARTARARGLDIHEHVSIEVAESEREGARKAMRVPPVLLPLAAAAAVIAAPWLVSEGSGFARSSSSPCSPSSSVVCR